MYDVNGLPPARMSTRRSASRRTTSTRFGDDWAAATCVAAANSATPHARSSHPLSRRNVVRMNLISESAKVLDRSVDRGSTFPARRQAGQHAAHVRERTLHSRKRIVLIDLVFQVDVAAVANALQLPEDLRNRHLPFTDDA